MGCGVAFEGVNVVYKGGHPDVADLPVFTNGRHVVSAWELSPEEVAEVVRTGRVYLAVLTHGPLLPAFVGSEATARELVENDGSGFTW